MNETYVIPFIVYSTVGFTLLLLALVYLLVRYKQRQYLYEADQKEREYLYNNELLNSRLELQEHVMDQVSKEIHDNVGQVLSLVKLNLFSIGNNITDEAPRRLVASSSELLNKAINDLRNLSHTQSAMLVQQNGLYETLVKEIGYINSLGQVHCDLSRDGDADILTPEQILLLYRIAQEAIQNSLKHAGAGRLSIRLINKDGFFEMVISDDGTGFEEKGLVDGNGIGIAHMRHRADLLNSELSIVSSADNGTTITLKMKL